MGKYSIKRAFFLLAIIAIMAACSSAPSSPTTAPIKTIPASKATQTPTSIPLNHMWIGVDTTKLSANVVAFLLEEQPSYGDSLLHSFIHPGLFRINPVTGAPAQWIAEKGDLEWVNKSETWAIQVTLNPSMQWNNGKPLTSDDIIYSFKIIKSITQSQTGIKKTALDALKIEKGPGETILLSVNRDPGLLPGLNAAITFPILNREFWEDRLGTLISSEEFRTLTSILNDLSLIEYQRGEFESRQGILLQQITDTNEMLAGTKGTLQYMQTYVDNKGWVNLNGVKDSEIAASYTQQIPGLTHLVVKMKVIYDDQLLQLATIQKELDDLNARKNILVQERQKVITSLASQYTENDQGFEPLLVQYGISIPETTGTAQLKALNHNERMPDVITFVPAAKTELLSQYSQGELDFVFTQNQVSDPGIQSSPSAFPVLTGMFFYPDSDVLLFPDIRTAVSCIYTAAEIWADEPHPGELLLTTPGRLPGPDGTTELCTGELPARLGFMLERLRDAGFTWQTNADGSIVPGSMLDPRGTSIPSILINIKPGIDLPAAVEEKLILSLQSIGIDVQFSRDNIEIDDLTQQESPVDIVISQWISDRYVPSSLCGIIPALNESDFPSKFLVQINTECNVNTTSNAITPGPSPTPPIMVSGKLPRQNDKVESVWYSLLYVNYPANFYPPDLESKFDLTWLKDLSPVWAAGWTR